ncbi:MAG: aminopeptidase P N-terminal domain-containing protein, partial [Spirochaetaceae bacterium]|nr:aminopeptidase P N-terminal domain-containing protein [Spirochaetaceae bacterium]
MFDATTYADRRRALVRALATEGAATGTVLLLGNPEAPRNYAGNPYRFRQDSSFLYFVGPALPSLAATIDAADGRTV